MVFEQIDQLKQQYTDKYVVVDEQRPELRRFRGRTGTVRTVNMSGRALVEFEGDNNIAWYDIDLDFLKVIDAPLPKPEQEKPAKKEAKAAPKAEKAAKPAAGKPGGKMSVEEMLAAARSGGKSTGAPAAKAEPTEKTEAKPAKKPGAMSVEEMLAAARGEKGGGASPGQKAAPAAKATSAGAGSADEVRAKLEASRKPAAGGESKSAPAASAPAKDPKSMSVAEMLAAARGEKGGAAPAAAKPPEPAATAVEEADEEFELEESAEEAPAKAAPVSRDQLPTGVDEIVAFCRKVDTK